MSVVVEDQELQGELVESESPENFFKDEPEEEVKEEVQEDDGIPERFRGKSAQEIAEMYQNLEKLNGRQANELGQLRAYADRLLQAPREEIDESMFFEEPSRAVEEAVVRNPEVQGIKGELSTVKLKLAQQEFTQAHPTWKKDAQSNEFLKWVTNTEYRGKLWQKANSYDFEAADELFTAFEDHMATVKQNRQADAQKREGDLMAASTETGSTGATSKKVWRRHDLMNMQTNDPDKYYDESFQAELLRAYAEGRVR